MTGGIGFAQEIEEIYPLYTAEIVDPTSPPASTPDPVRPSATARFPIDGETAWGGLIEMLSESEQSCIRGEIGSEGLDFVGSLTVMFSRTTLSEMESMFRCMGRQTAADLYVSKLLAEMAATGDEADEACLVEYVSGFDVARLIAGTQFFADPGDAALFVRFAAGIPECVTIRAPASARYPIDEETTWGALISNFNDLEMNCIGVELADVWSSRRPSTCSSPCSWLEWRKQTPWPTKPAWRHT